MDETVGIMTVEDVAGYLDVTPSTVYALAQKGKIPGRKIGRLWRFSKPAIVAWSGGDSAAEQTEMAGEVVGIQGLAQYLRVADSTVYEAAQKSTLPGRKVGRQWRFSLWIVAEWLKTNKVEVETDKVFNIQQVSRLLNLAPNTVYKAAQVGNIPGRKVGRQWRFAETNLYQWLGGVAL